MNFVTRLPWTYSGRNAIWDIVDRLTKNAYFLLIRTTDSISKLVHVYVDEIVRFYGVPLSIVFDCDPQFTSHF